MSFDKWKCHQFSLNLVGGYQHVQNRPDDLGVLMATEGGEGEAAITPGHLNQLDWDSTETGLKPLLHTGRTTLSANRASAIS
jgi:hypothetical protein